MSTVIESRARERKSVDGDRVGPERENASGLNEAESVDGGRDFRFVYIGKKGVGFWSQFHP